MRSELPVGRSGTTTTIYVDIKMTGIVDAIGQCNVQANTLTRTDGLVGSRCDGSEW